jgi:hypothetical protein
MKRVFLGPYYRTNECEHEGTSLPDCSTCALYEIAAEFVDVPRIGDGIWINRRDLKDGPPHREVAPEDDLDVWTVTDIQWHPDEAEPSIGLRFIADEK